MKPLEHLAEGFWDHIRVSITDYSLFTYKWQLQMFIDFVKRQGFTEINTHVVSKWITHLATERELKTLTIRHYRKLLKRFFNYLVQIGEVDSNPVITDRLPKLKPVVRVEKRTFQVEDFRRLVADMRQHQESDWHDYTIVGYYTGLRLGDVAQLKWIDVNWSEECLCLIPAKTKRFNKSVRIPMAPELFDVIESRRDNPDTRFGDLCNTYVFPDFYLSYSQQGHKQMVWLFNYRCVRAKVPRVGFHAMRHTFVSNMANANVSYQVIGSMTAQSAQQIAEYHHVTIEAQRAAIAKGF